jgi:hypothetical protein
MKTMVDGQRLLWVASSSRGFLTMRKLGFSPHPALTGCISEDGTHVDGYYIDYEDVKSVCELLLEVPIFYRT